MRRQVVGIKPIGDNGEPMAKAKIAPKPRASTKLSVIGKTVVITGTVPGMQRKDAEAKLVGLGATCTGSVSKKTDYVVVGADAGSKADKAKELGVAMLTEDEWLALIGSG